MLLFSYEITPRLSYITAFTGQLLFKKDIEITTDKEAFKTHVGPKINYSSKAVSEHEFQIAPVELLFEKTIRSVPVSCFKTKKYTAFFKTTNKDFPFDILAASFYLLSRYEEYLDHTKDHYGRYAHTNSLAERENFLHLPLVNIWLQDLKNALAVKYPAIQFVQNNFNFLPTYDIDLAYSFLYKGFLRNSAGFVRSLLKGEWKDVTERAAVLLKKQKDPFDSYDWLNHLHSRYGLKAYYFFLVAEKQTGYDKNITPSALPLQQLISKHAIRYNIGIHPSWQSGDNSYLLEREITLLREIAEKKIADSRQHYLRFTLPETYRNLIHSGIERDYSMGYGTTNGFRASVASSFYWYDLEREQTTGLLVYPFCFMDTNAYFHQKLSPWQAYDELVSYCNCIKAVNGLMITVWHNHILGTGTAFKGWREAYEKFISQSGLSGSKNSQD